jgi:transcriptional regulator with GAF, ATPase, and Fis domain
VAVNCAGLTEARLESELFGHLNGNMTGAFNEKRGKLRLAHRGTLFLDQVGDMILRMQAWLLRFLESGEIQALGSDESQAPVDVRVVAATNRNLNDLVAAGQFREDLLYRLRVIHLHVPPLRERAEDVHALMRHFLARFGRELSFTDGALRALLRYSWPGNVRELLNVVEQLVWLSADAVVGVQHLPVSIRSSVTADWEEDLDRARNASPPGSGNRRRAEDSLTRHLTTSAPVSWASRSAPYSQSLQRLWRLRIS